MNELQLEQLTANLVSAGKRVFTADGVLSNGQCAGMNYVSIRHSGLVVFAMPKIDFAFNAIDGFDYDHVQLSFSVDFLGCTVNSFTTNLEWAGNDCNIDTLFHKADWSVRPTLYGKTQQDGTVVWAVQGAKDITMLENMRVTTQAVKAIIKSMDAPAKKAFLQAIFLQVRDYVELPNSLATA